VEISTIRLLAKLPTIAAYAYKKSVGQPFLYPDNSLGLVENFLRMTFGFPAEPYDIDPDMAKALDLLFILHADHEQNCSTSTVRLVGSSEANLFASISAGINALFGPLHGGANQAVLEMLQRIKDDGGDVGEFVRKVKNKEQGVKLMGFGHRVYKNYDPRAAIVKKTADELLEKIRQSDGDVHDFVKRVKNKEDGVKLMGFGHRVYKNYDPRARIIKSAASDVFEVTGTNPLLDIALELEKIALEDDYFVKRKLYPNVDFYSGLIYEALHMPVGMFTVLFAIPRTSGWIAQWLELVTDKEQKIARPRQIYTGARGRDYVPIDQRS